MDLATLTGTIAGWLWSTPMILLCLGVGLYFTIAMKVPQARLLKDMVSNLLGGGDSENGISSFQGFAMALGGRIGVGNIAGVATAIYFGGPGAIFWMWVIAFVGAACAFSESALAQVWKEEINGEYRGGPAYYIEHGTGLKWLAVLFAIAGIIANALTGPTIQAFNIADAAKNAFGINPAIVGLSVAFLFAVIIFGGLKRIGKVAEYIVPFMAIVYIVLALIILVINARQIPSMFALIFRSAFGKEALFGAIYGKTIMWGVKRGVYSSEAGMGSGAQASAAAEVSHPAKQGLAQSFSVYVDTLFVCTATGLMILSTGCYNVVDAAGDLLVNNLPDVAQGTAYTQAAIDSVFPGFGSIFIAVAMFFFAFTTLLSFAVYSDCNVAYLFKNSKYFKQITMGFKVLLLVMIVFGSLRSSDVAWNMADIGVGLSAWINLIAMILLRKKAIAVLKDYEDQKKQGLDPVFSPEKAGFKNAGLWNSISKRSYSNLNAK
ncbi:alanine/glycine:cation symporter family protein [Filifactor villosus]|uniref:Alanine/glycine:cation symporter family protein n=2 Tax=Bacteria TaxID=2 RepID=A0ABV9QNM6_9FIRM